jgi:hypothetical protein
MYISSDLDQFIGQINIFFAFHLMQQLLLQIANKIGIPERERVEKGAEMLSV